jgi:hypothetical protein
VEATWAIFAGGDWSDAEFSFPQSTTRRYILGVSVEEIESAISKLPPADLSRLTRWFEKFAADEWDREIEADIRAGRLDAAGKRADEQFEAGNCTPL